MEKNIIEDRSRIKVAVGLSGGVDSSVAAYLLKEQGYDVTGVYIKCWDRKEDGCASDEDKAYALQTSVKLGIKFDTLDFVNEYKRRVIKYFYDEYERGRTPNPDVICNREIKFGMFFDWAEKNGFRYIATGHYACINKNDEGKLDLLKGMDKSKDQSYFLYLLKQKDLHKIMFPIGELKKSQVREIAKREKLPSAERPESMGICFIGEVNIREFLEKKIKHKRGTVLDLKGNVIGEHDGVSFFTIGQRHGFKINKYSPVPLYVVDKNIERNELIVGEEKDTFKDRFIVGNVEWIRNDKSFSDEKFECEIRIRHLGKMYKALVCRIDTDKGMYEVILQKKAFGVAPGQSCVFYNGDIVLGGSVIQ
jgi:tRNA-specific 2-thiouridylase